MKLCKFGADPEVFVSKDNEIVPAFTFLPSAADVAKLKKKNKYLHPAENPYWDGFQAEFATTARTCRDELTGQVHSGLFHLLNKGEGLTLDISSVVEIPKEILKSADQHHVNLGCEPSFNVYGIEPIDIKDSRRLKYRFAGYHFHFGIDQVDLFRKNKDQIENAVKNLDATIGLIGVILFENMDHPVRRKYYGRAGEFRLPAHGLEYRTLSSSVLVHPAIHNLLWDIAGRVVNLYTVSRYDKKLRVIDKDRKVDYAKVQKIINSYNAEAAREMILGQEKFLTEIFNMAYGYDPKVVEFAWKTILQPVEKTIPEIRWLDFIENYGRYADYGKNRFATLAGVKEMPDDGEWYRDRWMGEGEAEKLIEKESRLVYA